MARSHSREFKLSLCRSISEGNLTRYQASKEHKISHGLMERWMDQYEARGDEAFDGNPWRTNLNEKDQEIDRLKHELVLAQTEIRQLHDIFRQLGIEVGNRKRKL